MLRKVETGQQYDVTLVRIYDLMQTDVPVGSPEYNELEILVTRVKAYEYEHYPMTKRYAVLFSNSLNHN